MHGNATPVPASSDPVHHRISRLSLEFIDASPDRQVQIAQEVDALIAGRVQVLRPKTAS